MRLIKFVFFIFTLLVNQKSLADTNDYYQFSAKFGAPLAKYIKYPDCKYTDNQCRRWGIAVEIPVDHRIKSSVDLHYIKTLHAGGVNFIRFNSVDSKRNNVFQAWSSKKFLQANLLLQPMDKLIPLLSAHDMQYALSVNDFSSKAESSGASKNGYKVAHKQYKASQMTYLPSINITQEWLKWIYSRQVLEQRYSYGKDPGNRYITLVGEDSIHAIFFKNKGKFIDKHTALLLEKCITGNEKSLSYRFPSTTHLLRNTTDAKRVASCLAIEERRFYQQLLSPQLQSLLPNNVATSNSWYGLGYLLNSNQLGTFIDAHSYFDHVIYETGKHGRVEMVRNRSIIAEPGIKKHGQANLLRPNLISLFASAVDGKEMYVSEWNHPFWSDYAYEGPLLMTAYASYQNYPLVTMHTLMAWNDDKNKPFSNHGFSVHGNQILQVLNPTLSLVYRRGDIRSAENTKIISAQGTAASLTQEMFKVGLDPSLLSVEPERGLVSGIRLSFKNTIPPVENLEWNNGEFKTDSNQIQWHYGDIDNASFVVDTPMFKAIAGSLKTGVHANGLDVSANSHGAILVVSADGLPIKKSKSILLTIVSSQKTSGMQVDWIKKRGFDYLLKSIVNNGTDYVLLKKIEAKITLSDMDGTSYRLSAINDSISETELGEIKNKLNQLTFNIGKNNTPWYRLVRNDLSN